MNDPSFVFCPSRSHRDRAGDLFAANGIAVRDGGPFAAQHPLPGHDAPPGGPGSSGGPGGPCSTGQPGETRLSRRPLCAARPLSLAPPEVHAVRRSRCTPAVPGSLSGPVAPAHRVVQALRGAPRRRQPRHSRPDTLPTQNPGRPAGHRCPARARRPPAGSRATSRRLLGARRTSKLESFAGGEANRLVPLFLSCK